MGGAATYPTAIWDGDSVNRDSDNNNLKAPDHRDWSRVIKEVAAAQNQLGVGLDADAVAAVGTVGTDVTEISERTGVQRTVLTLTDVVVTIVDGATKATGGVLLHTLPAGAIKVLGVTMNLTAISAEDFSSGAGDYALGSTLIAANTAIATTAQTWSTDTAACTISSVVSDLHDQGETVALHDNTDASGGKVYLNIALDLNEGAGVITVNGTITLIWTNLGDY